MKKLFELKSHMISKLFIYQIAMSLLGFFIVSPFVNDISMCLPFGIFAMLFYFSLVCYAVVEDGQKDYISAQAGRGQATAFTGFKYALISYIPSAVITIAYMISRLVSPDEVITGIKLIVNMIIRFFLMGMYLGIDIFLRGEGMPKSIVFACDNGIFFVLCLVIMPVVAGFAYYLAYKGKVHINTAPKKKK